MANAIQVTTYGPPEVLVYSPVVLPPLQGLDVRIRTQVAAINHTDLEIRAGHWPVQKAEPFPYTPGVEVVGVIDEVGRDVADWSIGDAVLTMMQGMGGMLAQRAGGYADYVTVAASSLAALPADFTPLEMAAVGLGGVTAYEGLRRIGAIAGKRILITGAAGGVGSSGVSIAKAMGASVTAVVSREEHRAYVQELGADDVIVCPRGSPLSIAPNSMDGVLDSVAGVTFPSSVQALRSGGVLCLVGAMAGGDVAFDAWRLLGPVALTGYASEELDGQKLGHVVEALAQLKSRGMAVPTYQTAPISKAADAHRLLEAGGVKGRILLVSDSD
jgi:NADPH2:quinone reductase